MWGGQTQGLLKPESTRKPVEVFMKEQWSKPQTSCSTATTLRTICCLTAARKEKEWLLFTAAESLQLSDKAACSLFRKVFFSSFVFFLFLAYEVFLLSPEDQLVFLSVQRPPNGTTTKITEVAPEHGKVPQKRSQLEHILLTLPSSVSTSSASSVVSSKTMQ